MNNPVSLLNIGLCALFFFFSCDFSFHVFRSPADLLGFPASVTFVFIYIGKQWRIVIHFEVHIVECLLEIPIETGYSSGSTGQRVQIFTLCAAV